MKRNALWCVCIVLCLLFSACATPAPEESDLPAEESSESLSPIPEDPNAKAVRADLEELLALEGEWAQGKAVEWPTSQWAEAVRTRVKQLEAPILTEEDVLRIAKQAIFVVAAEQTQTLYLPACGVLATVAWSPTASSRTPDALYAALIAYTLYLFTPPEYVFRETEVWGTGTSSDPMLYLPLALPEAVHPSRTEALALLRRNENGVVLLLSGFSDDEEHPLDCFRCGTSVLLRQSSEMLSLGLMGLAQRENIPIPERLLIAFAEAYVQEWLVSVLDGDAAVYSEYACPGGDLLSLYQPFYTAVAREIRQNVERLPAPILTEKTVWRLESALSDQVQTASLLLLPGVDGKEDVLFPAVEGLREYLIWENEFSPDAKAHEAVAYLLDLFTPSAYRFTDFSGTYYALDADMRYFVLVTEGYKRGDRYEWLLYVTMEEPME